MKSKSEPGRERALKVSQTTMGRLQRSSLLSLPCLLTPDGHLASYTIIVSLIVHLPRLCIMAIIIMNRFVSAHGFLDGISELIEGYIGLSYEFLNQPTYL